MRFSKAEQETMQRAIEFYGKENQIDQYHEESAELTIALNKARRGSYKPPFIPDIVEEIADVYIMLYQLETIFGIQRAAVNHEIDRKLMRLKNRMDSNDMEPYKL